MKLSKVVCCMSEFVLGVSLAAAPLPQLPVESDGVEAQGKRTILPQVVDPVFVTDCIAPDAQASSVLVYIKVVIRKEFGWVAKNLGGMRDNTWRRTLYRPTNHWWENPLIVHSDPPIIKPDLIVDSDGQTMTGGGASKNITVRVHLVPHAELTVKTIPPSDAVQGTITCVIFAQASYFDGKWVEMVHEVDRTLTFKFDTRNPAQAMEVMDVETRTIPLFEFERYTRDQIKWEPKTRWPGTAVNGDWHVVIYGRNAVLKLTRYRYLQPDKASLPLPVP